MAKFAQLGKGGGLATRETCASIRIISCVATLIKGGFLREFYRMSRGGVTRKMNRSIK
jgi:hypothetical protein